MTSGRFAPGGDPGTSRGAPGGLPQPRIDQLYRPPPPVLAPGSTSGILRARVLIVSGPSGGIFVYNGTPALGNPPVFSVVAPGVTHDPFGNTVVAIMNVGNLHAAHFGVDNVGNLYLADATGTTRIYVSPTLAAELIYDTTGQSAGHLLTSIASAAAGDGHGNAALAGITSYSPSVAGTAIATQLAAGIIQWWNSSTGSGGPWSATGPSLQQANGLSMSSGTLGGGTAVVLSLSPETPNGVGVLSGSLGLAEQAAPSTALTLGAPQLYGSSATGMIRFVSDLAGGHGDGNAYDTGTLRVVTTASQLVNSTTSTPVAPSSGPALAFTPAAVQYKISGRLYGTQGAVNATQAIGFAGPATSAADIGVLAVDSTAGSAVIALGAAELTTLGPRVSFGAPTNTHTFWVDFEGMVTFSATGSPFQVTVSCVTLPADTWTVRAGSWLEASPIG